MKLNLDSENEIINDKIEEIEKYFSKISLSELLIINRIIVEETNHRIDALRTD